MTTNPPLPKEDLANMLRRKILSYKSARPNLSSQQIAKKFGMSSSTFSRIENLDIKTPTFDQVIKILTGTGHHKDLLGYLNENYPEIASTYKKGYSQPLGSEFISEDIADHLIDPQTSKLMLIAHSVSGLKKSVIIEEFGNSGLRILDSLIEKDILIEKESGVYFPRENGSMLDQRATRSLVDRSINDFYNINGFEDRTAANFLTFQSESIDLEKVYPMILSLLSELQRNVRDIFNDPENHGDETVFVSTVSDSLIKNNLATK
ncbi:MAG: helix-turn-helix transcriptional regulator [Bacteriovoracaceae bacterium]|jgi:transcriptional regulator with XRE-family HTH domain|nr:helix-turn-helix transcriptional regulator [Bacteriovoracaceae bacterium]